MASPVQDTAQSPAQAPMQSTHPVVIDVSRSEALQAADHLGIDFDRMPKVSGWYALMRLNPNVNDGSWRKLAAAVPIIGTSKALRRDLTQSEKDAVAYHNIKKAITPQYSFIPAALSATYFVRAGAAKWRFPFYTPGPSFDPKKFLALRGPQASLVWLLLRASAYFLVSDWTIRPIMISYANTVCRVATMKDPRLENLNKDVDSLHMQHTMIQLVNTEPLDQGSADLSLPSERTSSWTPPRVDLQTSSREAYGKVTAALDDARDTFEDTEQGFGESSGDERVATSARRYSPAPNRQPSAWDRLRSQGAPARTPSSEQDTTTEWTRRRGDAQREGEGQRNAAYSFSDDEEEKSLAKSQAQKDFDAMLEQERRGSSENDRYR